jgi:hypothetical protein
MDRPKNLYEQASYDLNQFRERRVADRRLTPRDTPDRRVSNQSPPAKDSNGSKGSNDAQP